MSLVAAVSWLIERIVPAFGALVKTPDHKGTPLDTCVTFSRRARKTGPMGDVSRRQPRGIALLAFALVCSLVTFAPLPAAAQEEPPEEVTPDTARAFGCVAGSGGFGSGGGAVLVPVPVPVQPQVGP